MDVLPPLSPGTAETLAWMLARLPAPPARLLEVGCGAGELAAALVGRGHGVQALDPDPGAVAEARARGVAAVHARFPVEPGGPSILGPFEAVLFVRSLHHQAPLSAALDAVHGLLAPGGRLLVEDWGWDELDLATAEWFYGLMALGRTQGWVPAGDWEGGTDPLAHWRSLQRATHADLQPRAVMRAEVERRFRIREEARAPYVYRLVARVLADAPEGPAVAAAVLAWERRLIACGAIVPIGWRLVAEPRTGGGP